MSVADGQRYFYALENNVRYPDYLWCEPAIPEIENKKMRKQSNTSIHFDPRSEVSDPDPDPGLVLSLSPKAMSETGSGHIRVP